MGKASRVRLKAFENEEHEEYESHLLVLTVDPVEDVAPDVAGLAVAVADVFVHHVGDHVERRALIGERARDHLACESERSNERSELC